MKELKLKSVLKSKLNRLDKKVGSLSYLGVDPNTFADKPMVAVVGTRKPTPYGKQVTEQIVSDLARAGVVIVSGLAFGVDVLAHKAALNRGGINISVLPSGIKNIYPATNKRVGEEITVKGCLISEYPAHHQPRKAEFLQRNRIVAALSDAILIPEAAEYSGSLNTAGHASKMNIPVCAIPGPVSSSMSSGTNKLIKNGANLVTNAQDLLKILNINPNNKVVSSGRNYQETAVLELIKAGVNDSFMLQENLQVKVVELQNIMTELEIDGLVKQNELGKWQIK